MIEPLAVAVHAAKRFPELAGAKVAILGSGPIGILLAQSCKALGAAPGAHYRYLRRPAGAGPELWGGLRSEHSDT